MATENIVSKKFRILVDKSTHLFDRISFWTRASDVEFNSGKNAQDTLGSIYGISDSLTSTSSNIAASTKAVKAINDKVTNVALGNATQADVLTGKTFSSSAGINKTGTMNNLSGAVGYSNVADGGTFARIVLGNTGKITQGTSYVDVPVQTLKDNVSNLNGAVKTVLLVSASCEQPHNYDYDAKITVTDLVNNSAIFNVTWSDQGSSEVLRGSFTLEGKTYTVYEVKDGLITIKDKQYPIKLIDGYYIIRKLTVSECKRLQTIPEWYEFPVSDTQAYKMLGNGWTVDVIAHLIKATLNNT